MPHLQNSYDYDIIDDVNDIFSVFTKIDKNISLFYKHGYDKTNDVYDIFLNSPTLIHIFDSLLYKETLNRVTLNKVFCYMTT